MMFIGFAIFIVLVSCYLALVAFGAKHDTDNAPRTDLLECKKHGPLPAQYFIKIADLGTENPVPVCPICYEEAFKQARVTLNKPEKRY